ncbi:bifunctional UDP-N-acetylglucosamine diphosphorylase/glucosamine-1-phosphate N-acetyltransferase GlmU [Candidatus Poribacteria bacterium]|nr:bifunctional UDP-N-acetylglucosamine diphosphorylase/glucosamine-1-phosphate N-acetyltransferase GlmU [Candidatus Poribacteria bacterium]
MQKVSAIVLAAGAGTRMKSDLPKVLHPICGKPMVHYILKTIQSLKLEKKILIVGNQEELVKKSLENEKKILFVSQKTQSGTGHAVKQAKNEFDNYKGDVLVLCADTPLLKKDTLEKLIKLHHRMDADATMLTCIMNNPFGYGRIIRNKQNQVIKIVEEKDSSKEEKSVKEINTGIYCFNAKKLFDALQYLKPNNKQKELYLTDVIEAFFKKNYKIETILDENKSEVMGINNRVELAQAADITRKSILEYWMKNGVTIIHPESTFIDEKVEIEKDTVIYPFTIIEGNSIIKSYCKIGPYTHIRNSSISSYTEIIHSVVLNSIIHEEVKVGPFANIRPNSILEAKVKIGNFCEVKKTHVGKGSKIPHLSYVGDSSIGKDVNIGAGTITCNFDGINKSKTVINDNVFIGSNTNLIAPVKIGKNAIVAAGSTITKDVLPDALGIAREKQINIPQYNKKKKKLLASIRNITNKRINGENNA